MTIHLRYGNLDMIVGECQATVNESLNGPRRVQMVSSSALGVLSFCFRSFQK